MLKFLRKNIVSVLIAIVSYIVLLVAGEYVLTYVPYLAHSSFLNKTAAEVAEYYNQNGNLDGCEIYGMGCKVYDKDMNLQYELLPNDIVLNEESRIFFKSLLLPYVDRVSGGNQFHRVIISPVNRLGIIIVGLPVDDNCALFLLRDLHDLYQTLLTYGVVFTVIFAFGAIFYFITLNKSQKLDKKQEDYLANFTHDLKSPISSIRLLAEALQAKQDPSDYESHRDFDVIISESYKLEHTVKDILELSSIQNKSTSMEKVKTNLSDVFAPVFDKYISLANDMMIDFTISPKFDDLPVFYTNGKQIARVMDILLDNAFKYSGFEGKIDVELKKESTRAIISVKDNGVGISKEDQKKIFDRFYMADHSRKSKGSGLGLSIAKEIISNLGEKIWVESEEGQGAIFFFTIHYSS